jgi:hypothetical protein
VARGAADARLRCCAGRRQATTPAPLRPRRASPLPLAKRGMILRRVRAHASHRLRSRSADGLEAPRRDRCVRDVPPHPYLSPRDAEAVRAHASHRLRSDLPTASKHHDATGASATCLLTPISPQEMLRLCAHTLRTGLVRICRRPRSHHDATAATASGRGSAASGNARAKKGVR